MSKIEIKHNRLLFQQYSISFTRIQIHVLPIHKWKANRRTVRIKSVVWQALVTPNDRTAQSISLSPSTPLNMNGTDVGITSSDLVIPYFAWITVLQDLNASPFTRHPSHESLKEEVVQRSKRILSHLQEYKGPAVGSWNEGGRVTKFRVSHNSDPNYKHSLVRLRHNFDCFRSLGSWSCDVGPQDLWWGVVQ